MTPPEHRAYVCNAAVRVSATFVFAGVAACAGARLAVPPAPPLPFAADSLRTAVMSAGVVHRFIYTSTGPWAINVLDVDLDQCYSAVAVKSGDGAIGRERTTELLRQLSATADAVAGVNADFFSLASPPGVPTGAHISRGRVVTGPGAQPVLAFDSAGTAHSVTLMATGHARTRTLDIPVSAWNRAASAGLALYDANWARAMDTASGVIEVVLQRTRPRGDSARVVRVDTATAGAEIPRDGWVLIAGRGAPGAVRGALRALTPGDIMHVNVSLAPFHPLEAVGGRPMLARDSVVLGVVDTEGQPGFATGRHPRTAAGLARGGRRLLLVVVDGRRATYSDGMTLRELANLMLALGARDAINLDGGGSTTFALAVRDTARAFRVVNRPSDITGERTVGNALAIVRGCGRAG